MIKIFIFCAKSFNFDQTYLNTGLKTQNMEELSLDLIFHNNFWWNIKSFSKKNSKLRIHSKPDRNQSKLTVCIGCINCCLIFYRKKHIKASLQQSYIAAHLYIILPTVSSHSNWGQDQMLKSEQLLCLMIWLLTTETRHPK